MELTLTRSEVTAWQVTVTCDGAFSHAFDLSALIPTKAAELPHPLDDPVAYGKALYAALFPLGSLAQHALAAKPKCMVLVAADDDLDAIPWEYAYGPGGLLACACSLVRGLPLGQRSAPPDRLNGLHIVAIASSPLDHRLAPLNIQGEWTRLTEIVDGLYQAVRLERAWPPTIECLRDLVVGQQQLVVHFMGHGGQNKEGEAVLCFERENGAREEITAREFVQRVQNAVFLVTLNACQSAAPGQTLFSNLARALVREQVPYALGMRFFVHDENALVFARTFYSDLARGGAVEEALRQARLTLARSAQAWAAGNLVLYTSLTHPAPGYTVESGEPDVRDKQEDSLRGIINVLPEVQGAFQGRIDEQVQLGNSLTGDHRPRLMTIHGSGGQGKTALARVAAQRFAHAWPGGVWAISLETLLVRAVFVASLARFLGLSPQDSADAADLERDVLLRLRRKRTLLVLDNLEMLDEAAKAQDEEALALLAFIQQLAGERTSLLCTSRHLLGWSGEQHLELPGLLPDEGAALFAQSAPDRSEEIELALARQLSRRIDGHPFGLFLLGKAFNDTALPLEAFLADYETFLLNAENRYVGLDHRQRTLYANIEYSVHWLPPELRETLSKLWVFHAPFVPEAAVAIFDPEHDQNAKFRSPVEDQLFVLWQRGLLIWDKTIEQVLRFYRVPSVIRPYIEQYVATADEREALLEQFGTVYGREARYLYNGLDYQDIAIYIASLCKDDLDRGVLYLEGTEQGYYSLCWGWILKRLGDVRRALLLTEQALAIGQGQELQLELNALNNLALLYLSLGDSQRALRLYEQALSMIRKTGDREKEAAALHNVAQVYHTIGQPEHEQDLYEQSLAIRRELQDQEGEIATLNNLATIYQRTGRGRQALVIYEQILPIVRQVGNRIGEATVINNMADMYVGLGKHPLALELYEQSLSIRQEMRDRTGEIITCNNLATAYRTLGQFEQALEILKRALVIERAVEDRARETITLNLMAYIQSDMHRYPEALSSFEEAMKVEQQLDLLANVASDLVSIALLLYQHLDNAAEAIRRMEQAVEVLIEAELSQDSAGHTLQTIQNHLTAMRQRLPIGETLSDTLAIPPERVEQIIATTVAIMTKGPSQRDMWRETIANLSLQAQQMGKQVDLEFFSAILELLDGKVSMLPEDHPYAQALASIQDGIAKGGLEQLDEHDVTEERQAQATFVQVSVAALRSPDPQEKMAFMQRLVALQEQVPDDELKALFQVIQLSLFGGDLTHLGDNLTGLARQVWEMIVAGVQQDDSLPHEP